MPCSQSSDPLASWQYWNCVLWWLLWFLCPWYGLAVSLWGQRSSWALVPVGAGELLAFGSCQSQVLLTPLYPCWAQGLGTAVCPLHVQLSCPTLWAGAWAGLCSRTGMCCSSPMSGLASSPSHCCPQRQGGGFSAWSHQKWGCKGSCSAEPICVPSGSLFLTPAFGNAAPCFSPSASHPALLLPCLGPSTPSSLGTPWLVPSATACREWCCSCPGRGRDRVQCFLAGEGRFVPASASFPCLSPIYLHPWLQRWNVPGATTSDCRSGSCLLPAPHQAAPGSQPCHSSSFPGKARTF